MMSIESRDLFNAAKSTNFRDYIEQFYGHEFVRNRTICPFHADTRPSATIKVLENEVFRCHACGWTKGIIDYVMEREKCSNFEAAKKICLDMNWYTEEDFVERELTLEEKKEFAEKKAFREKEAAARNAALEKKKASRRAALERSQTSVLQRVQTQAPQLLENFFTLKDELKDPIKKMFINWDKVSVWAFEYIGYSFEHDSVCIINRRTGENGYVSNIKHRQKYLWEDQHLNKNMRMDGKWIGERHLAATPFPLDYFLEHQDDRVVICEGEKDALNLLAYGINTLTLGGVSNSWLDNNARELLRDKDVYIWFDHDKAGYENAVKKAKEFDGVAASVRIVSFMHIDRTLENKYDISDYLFAQKFLDKENIFKSLTFNAFALTNQIIDDFAAYYDEESFTTAMQRERSIAIRKSFDKDIVHLLRQKSTNVASANKEELDALEDAMKSIAPLKDAFRGAGLNEDEAVKKLTHALSLKQALLNQHRKMGESDIADHVIALAKKEGHEFASFRNELYVWNGMHFEELSQQQIVRFLMDWMEDPQAGRVNQKQRTPDMVDKIIKHIKYKGIHLEPIQKRQQDLGIRVINTLNGSLLIYKSGKHTFKNVHDPKDGCMNVLDIEYKPEARAPKWNKFLTRVLPDETERKALMQFFGYVLYPKHLYETFLFLYGESGANGKSVILETMRNCFGKDMVSDLDLQEFDKHRIGALEGKFLNIGAEIDAQNLRDGQFSRLKKASGGEPIYVDPKGSKGYSIYEDAIPKFVFAGNSKPRAGMDGGVFRRIVFLDFKQEIPVSERVDKLSQRFNDEMSGIINMALYELKGLIHAGKFAESEAMTSSKDEYKSQTDPILAYAKEHIIISDGFMIPKKYAYAHYKAWCEETGHNAAAQKTFVDRLSKHRSFEEKRKEFKEGNLGKGLALSDYYLVGIEFNPKGNIPHYKLKGIELATSHSNFNEAERIISVRQGLFHENA